MELDLRFKQYEMNAEQINDVGESLESFSPTRPHHEILDFIENNRKTFSYKDFLPLVKKIKGTLELNLEDGSEVKISVDEGIVNLGIKYPDKSKFIASWTNIEDMKVFRDKCSKLK